MQGRREKIVLMLYKFVFAPHDSPGDSVSRESIAMDVSAGLVSQTMSRGYNLDRILTLAYNKLIKHYESDAEKLNFYDPGIDSKLGFRVETRRVDQNAIDMMTDVEIVRGGSVFVDIWVMTPAGCYVQLNDSDKPVVATWEPKLELPHLRRCFPSYYGEETNKKKT